MKVFIGPYRNWIGPYQIADLLQFVGVGKDRCHSIGNWLSENTLLPKICEWIDRRKSRKVHIKIHPYDTWSMDSTLAMIILPMLIQLKATKHGSPGVDDEDVPEYLRSSEAPPKENEWDIDALWHERWEWILNELIWTFEQLQPDYDWEDQYRSGEIDMEWIPSDQLDENQKPISYEMRRTEHDTFQVDLEARNAHAERISRGLRLFGKYYQGLWD